MILTNLSNDKSLVVPSNFPSRNKLKIISRHSDDFFFRRQKKSIFFGLFWLGPKLWFGSILKLNRHSFLLVFNTFLFWMDKEWEFFKNMCFFQNVQNSTSLHYGSNFTSQNVFVNKTRLSDNRKIIPKVKL